MKWNNNTNTRSLLFLFILVYTVLQLALIPMIPNHVGLIVMLTLVPPLFSFCLLSYIAHAMPSSFGRFWTLLSWSCLLYGAGIVSWYIYVLVYDCDPPAPSLADILWNFQSLLLLTSFIYLLFKKRSIYRGMRYMFDTLTIVLVLATVCWVYVLAPSLNAIKSNMDWLTFAGTALYPVYDLVLFSGMVTLYFAYRTFLPAQAWAIMMTAIVLIGCSDFYYMLISVGTPYVGSWVVPFYNLGVMMFPIAGLISLQNLPVIRAQDRDRLQAHSRMRLFVPGVSLAILILVAVEQIDAWNSSLIGAGLAVVLIVIRQMVVLRENDALMEQSQHMLERYEYMANHDALSGLPNRRYFEGQVVAALDGRGEDGIVAVMLLDLDRFKYANDTYGHLAGDHIIREVARRLTFVMGQYGTVARQSGDEFAILLTSALQPGEVSVWAQRIQAEIDKPFELLQRIEYIMSVSIGIAIAQQHTAGHELMRNADLALYRAKNQGGGKYAFYVEEMTTAIALQLEMEQALRKAIEQGELQLHYQPQFSAATQEIVGAEALIRWQPKNGTSVSPAVFIPIAEETGLIVSIGEWVTRTACKQAVAWMNSGMQPFPISVNVSQRQFQETDFVANVISILQETGLPPELLVLEITESIAIADERETVAKLLELKRCGIQIAMDDFGTGYSSLGVLKRYRVDKLKIDRAFVRDIGENEDQSTIIEAILAMAASLKVEVIAEGVETQEQYQFLQARGCGWIQGFYFSKPLPSHDFERRFLLKAGNQ